MLSGNKGVDIFSQISAIRKGVWAYMDATLLLYKTDT